MVFDWPQAISFMSAMAAAFSAAIAYRSKCGADKAECTRRKRELVLVANRILLAKTEIDDLSEDLISKFDHLARITNTGGGSSHQLSIQQVKDRKGRIDVIYKAVEGFPNNGLDAVGDDDLIKKLLEFEGYQITVDTTRNLFLRRLEWIENLSLSLSVSKG